MAKAADAKRDDAGRVFAALADPTRRRIVYELSADGPLTATQLAPRVGISRQAAAKHLLALADAELATGERIGRETRFELDTRPFAEAESWMRAIGALWDRRLRALRSSSNAAPELCLRPTTSSLEWFAVLREACQQRFEICPRIAEARDGRTGELPDTGFNGLRTKSLVEMPSALVRLESPEIDPLPTPLAQSGSRLTHQSSCDPSSLDIVAHMEVVEQRSPLRVVIDDGVNESHQFAALLRNDRDGAHLASRVGESPAPCFGAFRRDVLVEVAIRQQTTEGATPAVGVKRSDRPLVTLSREAVSDRSGVIHLTHLDLLTGWRSEPPSAIRPARIRSWCPRQESDLRHPV